MPGSETSVIEGIWLFAFKLIIGIFRDKELVYYNFPVYCIAVSFDFALSAVFVSTRYTVASIPIFDPVHPTF